MYAIFEPHVVGPFPHRSWPGERDNEWLADELDFLWRMYFDDVKRANMVRIMFARSWKTRLGMITLSTSGRTTYIAINSLLCDRQVPWYVPTITIAHELVHYAHGFGSPLDRTKPHPHKGGVVPKELRSRGLDVEYRLFDNWANEHWQAFYSRATSALKLVPELSASV
jgi:hypothetical protein